MTDVNIKMENRTAMYNIKGITTGYMIFLLVMCYACKQLKNSIITQHQYSSIDSCVHYSLYKLSARFAIQIIFEFSHIFGSFVPRANALHWLQKMSGIVFVSFAFKQTEMPAFTAFLVANSNGIINKYYV
jgi:hypothetical protein